MFKSFPCFLCFLCDYLLSNYCFTFKNLSKMKIKLTKAQIEEILANPEKAQEAGIKPNDPWWVIVLKVIAYIIGLILAGAVTTSCAAAACAFM